MSRIPYNDERRPGNWGAFSISDKNPRDTPREELYLIVSQRSQQLRE
jgi:hypothetical protein